MAVPAVISISLILSKSVINSFPVVNVPLYSMSTTSARFIVGAADIVAVAWLLLIFEPFAIFTLLPFRFNNPLLSHNLLVISVFAFKRTEEPIFSIFR